MTSKFFGFLIWLFALFIFPTYSALARENRPEKANLHNKRTVRPTPSVNPLPNANQPKPEDLQLPIIPVAIPSSAVEALYPDEIGQDLSDLVLKLSNRLDSFFGEERNDSELNGSTLKVVPSYTFYNNTDNVFELGVNLNLKLKNLESKARKLENKIKEEILPDHFGSSAKDKNSNSSSDKSTTKSKAIEEAESWHYNFESRLAARPAIYYSGKIKLRRGFEDAIFLHQFALSFGWDTDDYWSQRTSFYTDRALSDSVLFRFAHDGDWYINRQKFQSSHGPSLFQTINKYNSVSYNMRYSMGILDDYYQHVESTITINYRHGTPSKKIYIDLIPGWSYPLAQDFKENRSFQIRIEYLFGDVK
jgi:hypothetical protein